MGTATGLSRVRELFEARDRRARELQAAGTRVIGYLCTFPPAEIVAAAGFLPYRLMGRPQDDVVEANGVIETLGCPYVRNCLEQAMRGNLGFLEGVVIAHSCDMVQRVYGPWKCSQQPSYSYLLNVPHRASRWSLQFFERELGFFAESLEKHGGAKVTEERLLAEIAVTNENRRMVRELYRRRAAHASITGVELQELLVVGMSIPAREFGALLREVLAETDGRKPQHAGAPRILVWGSIIDHPKLYAIIERAGGAVVGDDNCIGTRSYFNDVDVSAGAMKGLTGAYFERFQCPRTDRGPGPARFDYLLDLVTRYGAEGVVCYTYSYCDPHKLDYPELRDLLVAKGIPTVAIEDDYTLGNVDMIANRVLPFVEALRARRPAAGEAA